METGENTQGPGALPLDRAGLEASQVAILNHGRWGNALVRLCRCGDDRWVVKDFSRCPPVIRQLWGARMVCRELGALQRLQGVAGIPQDVRRIDRYALAYRFVAGRALCDVPRELTDGAFFEALERLVRQMHACGVAHLDLRYRRNILVGEDGRPYLLDFQSHVRMAGLPAVLRNWLARTDLSGVYKHWCKRSPETLGEARASLLLSHNRRRRMWVIKGYGIQMGRKRRQRYERYLEDAAVRKGEGGND